MDNPKYSIVIVTWNGLEYLKTYLPKVYECTHPSYEVVIADNYSTDGTKEWLAAHFPQAIHAAFDDNYGYCGGNNRALPFCKGEIIIFLNNDAYPDPNWLDSMDEAFKDESIAALQPKLRAVREPQMFEYAGAAGGYLDRLGYPFCAGRIFDELEKDEAQFESQRNILWATGAAIAVRKQSFQDLEGFNEHFEFHMEEIDLCWRIWRSGKRVVYLPNSLAYHYGGGSLPMGSPRKVYYNFRNSLFMLTRNAEGWLPWVIFQRLLLDGVAGIKSLVEGKFADVGAIFKSHMHFYANLPRLLGERKAFKKRFKEQSDIPIYPKLLIKAYFVDKKSRFQQYAKDIPNLHEHA